MWLITKTAGFISVVQHNEDPKMLRIRTRTERHMRALCAELDEYDREKDPPRAEGIIDFGADAPDYRWHLNVERHIFGKYMADEIAAIDYTSHVKESVSGDDSELYSAMMSAWSVFMRLQNPPVKGNPAQTSWWDDADIIERIPRVDTNPFAAAARQVAGHVDDDGGDDEMTYVNVILDDNGTPRDIRIHIADPDVLGVDDDEWYESHLIPAVRAAGWDSDTIDDWWFDD